MSARLAPPTGISTERNEASAALTESSLRIEQVRNTERVRLAGDRPTQRPGNGWQELLLMRLMPFIAIVLASSIAAAEEPAHLWSLQPLEAPSRSGIDNFLQSTGPVADRRTLARRLYFDLTGLPPAPTDVEAFLGDSRIDSYERLVDRLLASPAYGERQARVWLDLVRYAESDGYKADVYRPAAWRYRDYVVRAFNSDKPYDRFLQEQLAGDELFLKDLDARIATGYLRLWPYEDNQADVARQWEAILTDITDVTGEAILGLSYGCARCHDHKYDPISREDYYRLQAFFAGIVPRTDLTLATPEEMEVYRAKLAEWEAATEPIRAEIAAIEGPAIEKKRAESISRYPVYLQAIYAKEAGERTPLEQQYVYLGEVQSVQRTKDYAALIPADQRKHSSELRERLKQYDSLKPPPPPTVLGVTDIGPVAAPTFIPGREDEPIEPGLLSVWNESPAAVEPIPEYPQTTGRRAALARQITRPGSVEAGLVARVMVNRIWQQHFGVGLVATPNDFGHQGAPPTNPQLLDWLAGRFIESGWSIKAMHRLVVTSSAYRQVQPVRRLEAEQVRDAMLSVSGELDTAPCKEGVNGDVVRRSVYVKMVRNQPDAMLVGLDLPDSFTSCGRRSVTTTPLQSLMLINGEFALKRAQAFAHRVAQESSRDPSSLIEQACLFALGRPPTDAERGAALAMFSAASDPGEALTDLCHVLLNSNAFIYLD